MVATDRGEVHAVHDAQGTVPAPRAHDRVNGGVGERTIELAGANDIRSGQVPVAPCGGNEQLDPVSESPEHGDALAEVPGLRPRGRRDDADGAAGRQRGSAQNHEEIVTRS
jgi:hypothetical protein